MDPTLSFAGGDDAQASLDLQGKGSRVVGDVKPSKNTVIPDGRHLYLLQCWAATVEVQWASML